MEGSDYKERYARMLMPFGLGWLVKRSLASWASRRGVYLEFRRGSYECKLWQVPVKIKISGYPTLVDEFAAELTNTESL